MNRKGQPSTNAKSSSSKRPNLTYAQSAGNQPARSASPGVSDKTSSTAPGPVAPQTKPGSHGAVAKQGRQQTPEHAPASNGGPAVTARSNSSAGGPRSHSRDAPVRMPTRNSVSSATTPAIQFGSLNQQARASPPPAAHRPSSTAATSGGVPVAPGKPASKPNFGTIASSSDEGSRKQHSSQGASDTPSRGGHHGRQQGHSHHPQQQQQQQQRPGSRSSGHGRQGQGYGAGRKDSGSHKHGGGQKGGPKPQDAASSVSTASSAEIALPTPHVESTVGYPAGQPAAVPMPGAPIAYPPGAMSVQQQPPQQQLYPGSPYRGQGHQHARPPHSQGPGGQYKPQPGAHYQQHPMGTQPMPRPMAYPMPAPGQPPMQGPIMTTQPSMPPMQGWMPPPHQFAYVPMGAPGYEQFYRQAQSAGGPPPPPHNIYGIPGYSMPNPTHAAVSTQIGAGGVMPGPMSGAHMPSMTASPMPGHPQPQHHHIHHSHPHAHALSASAQAFVPGVRRPVRIVNPTTNEEVDVSQQRLRSASAASSTPHNVASGTASPAPGSISEKNDGAVDPAAAEENAKPKFKIPSARTIKIVNPNVVAKADGDAADAKAPVAPVAKDAAVATEAAEAGAAPAAAPDTAPEDDAGAKPMDVDEKEEEHVEEEVAVVEEPKQEVASAASPAAAAPAAVEAAKPDVAPIPEKPVETQPAETQPAETQPAEAQPVETQPVEAQPVETQPVEEPVVAEPAAEAEAPVKQTEPREPEPAREEHPVDALADSLSRATLAEGADVEPKVVASPSKAEKDESMEVDGEESEEEEEEEEEEDEGEEYEEEPAEDATQASGASAESEPADDDDQEAEDGEIDESKASAKSSAAGQGRARQVTFSESATTAARMLSPEEIVKLYGNDASAPRIVGEILRYPRVFLERFEGLGKAPERFHFEITSTDDRWPADRGSSMRRSASGSGRHRESAAAASGFGGMGNFRSNPLNSPLPSSEERFKQSTIDLKRGLEPGRGPMLGGRSTSGQYRGPGGGRESRESRGGRSGARVRGRGRGRGGSQQGGDRGVAPMSAEFLANLKPLEKSEGRYIAKVLRTDNGAEEEDDMQEEVYDRGIRVLLNKITPDNFGVVSNQLLAWGEKSAKETDGRIMRHLIMLVFQKATDEPPWAEMYARLCHKLILNTSDNVQDHSLTRNGEHMAGGYLVRKYLLTKCQEDFERGWRVEIPMDIESSEYYDAIQIKRRGLGLVKFIGELFLLDVLTLRIMHECVKRLLASYEMPEEEETESLAKLLTTVGKKLEDDVSSKSLMDVYFARIQTMAANKSLTSRIRFMLQDVLELRQKRWASADDKAGPKTIAEVHEDIERSKAAQEAMRRAPSHTGRRPESHSGRGDGHGGGRRGGWSMVGGASGSGREQPQRAGDLSRFGNLSRSNQAPMSGGSPGNPFGAFPGAANRWRTGSSDGRKNRDDRAGPAAGGLGSRTVSHSSRNDSVAATPEPVGTRNMFEALLANEEEDSPHVEAAKGASRVPSLPPAAMSSTAGGAERPKTMDTATLQRKVQGLVSEFLHLQSESELAECFEELGKANAQNAVYEIANNIMARRPEEAEQVASGVRALRDKGLLTEDVAVAALTEYSEQLEDMALDAPNAYRFFGMLMAAARVPVARASEPLGDLASRLTSMRPPPLQVTLAFVKHLAALDGADEAKAAVAAAKLDIKRFFNPERSSDAEIKKTLAFQDLLDMFPEYA
ncbi:hypothetical protein LPJ61_002432 [Coemansia biformis]|uniref:MI domain-containing protein n=1 Tax=Coemansia biformis TaxID=1286918 RepID=A0A9W7YF08_9FUNG|nr:hypothetical protein LPJ61_002432 [Coemansia biformis]